MTFEALAAGTVGTGESDPGIEATEGAVTWGVPGLAAALGARRRGPAAAVPGAAAGRPGARVSVRVPVGGLRKGEGLTLVALAGLVNGGKPTVWAWEPGKSCPTPERIAALARFLGVAEDELLSGRDGNALALALGQARAMVAEAFGFDQARVNVSIAHQVERTRLDLTYPEFNYLHPAASP